MLHARFDDRIAGTALTFSTCERVIEARTPAEVRPALREVQAAVDAGSWAFGMIAYEAAAGLDPDARVRPGTPGFPLVRFGISAAPDREPAPLPEHAPGDSASGPFAGEWTAAEHAARVDEVRAAIARGDTYQVNLTTRLRGRVRGDLLAVHRDLLGSQRPAHAAYLDLGRWAVLSASPELFLDRIGERIRTAPMKGTAPRGTSPARDAAARARLLQSEKERAENIMIADLLRNDLARIAVPGTVEVPHLLTAEPYPTLWQLTSTVQAQARADLGLEELMEALFPCGSITGAPKLSTMEIIARLESSPRDVYCGAIGVLSPARRAEDGTQIPARTRFSVAIRTLLVDREEGMATYGVGGGITWGSRADAEWDELATKSRILAALPRTSADAAGAGADATGAGADTAGVDAAVPPPGDGDLLDGFGLIETMALEAGRPRHLEEHLDRLVATAARFAIPCDRAHLRSLLEEAAATADGDVLRLQLGLDGAASITVRRLPPAGEGPVLLAIDDAPRDPDAPEVRCKTTDRAQIDAALARARAADPRAQDVVLRGRDGRAAETTIAHLVVRIDGSWRTPPLEDGCLDGVGRRLLLARGMPGADAADGRREQVREGPVDLAQLRAAEEILLVSSVRGIRRAALLPDAR